MSYILVIVLISLLILIHEAGHFLLAKMCHVPIRQFSIGFGKKLWGFQYKETEYRLSLILLGGYVLPAFEDEREFFQIPLYKRVLFSIGGPLANILMALALLSVGNAFSAGFSLQTTFLAPFSQLAQSLAQFLFAISQLFSQPENLSGIVGIVATGGQFIQSNILKIIQLAIMLNLNLAFFNLLPLPPLDGGKILLYGLEKIDQRLVKLHIPMTVAGWVCMLGLMLYATAGDIAKYIIQTGV